MGCHFCYMLEVKVPGGSHIAPLIIRVPYFSPPGVQLLCNYNVMHVSRVAVKGKIPNSALYSMTVYLHIFRVPHIRVNNNSKTCRY